MKLKIERTFAKATSYEDFFQSPIIPKRRGYGEYGLELGKGGGIGLGIGWYSDGLSCLAYGSICDYGSGAGEGFLIEK